VVGSWRSRSLRLLLPLLVAVVLASGCGIQTQVQVTDRSNGTGTVAVVVTLDRAATAAVGDVAGQLQTSDLVRAGWTVRTSRGTAGSTVIRAIHGYSTPAQASALVADIAGTGPVASRPFRLTLTRTHGWWRSTTQVRGVADLRCDLACFGDPGLTGQLGQSTGVSPGPVAEQKRKFTFGLAVTIPGRVGATNATVRTTHTVGWNPPLGTRTVLLATSSSVSVSHVVITVAAAAVILLVVLVVAVIGLRRRRRRRRRSRGAHSPGGRAPSDGPSASPASSRQPVTPAP
jgi:hypothetical protein